MAALMRLGRAPYAEVLALQERLLAERIAGERPDTVIVVEHDPVYTVGRRRGAEANLLDVGDTPVVAVSRGGDVTWHGPGQVVAYPIVRMPDGDLHAHMRRLEAVMVAACAAFGLHAGPDPRNTGTWVDGRKVGSVGIASRSQVAWHGMALNVDPDLRAFARVNPCGFPSAIMTSMTVERGAPVSLHAVMDVVAEQFSAW